MLTDFVNANAPKVAKLRSTAVVVKDVSVLSSQQDLSNLEVTLIATLYKHQFEWLKQNGTRCVGPDVVFFYAAPAPAEPTVKANSKKTRTASVRLGFSVSRHCGSSVVRSRLKRVFREAFRSQYRSHKKEWASAWIQIVPKRGRSWSQPRELSLDWSLRQCQDLFAHFSKR